MIPYLYLFVLILVLLTFGGFLSASETALTASSKAKVHQMMKEGNPRAKAISGLQKNMSKTLSSILLCATLVITSLTTAMDQIFELSGIESLVLAPLITSMVVTIYVETIPKIVTVNFPEKFLLTGVPFLSFICRVSNPITIIIQYIARNTLRLFGYKIYHDSNHYSTVDELRGLIDLHHGPGQDVPHERAMLKSILDLGSVQVGEIMTHRKNVTMIDASDSPTEIMNQVLQSPFTRFPMWKDNPDNIIGVLNTKALLRAMRSHTDSIDTLYIETVASKPWFIPENADLLDQLQAFRNRREHFALVVDEYGSLLGIVTLEDILEEIVGEISDEHDIAVRGVRPQTDGSYIVDGNVTIRDLNRQMDWELPDEDASTIAGLALYEARVIPNVGQTFMISGFRFEVMRRHRNQVTLLRITPPSQE